MPPLSRLVLACALLPALLAKGHAVEPTAVIDTTAGRLTCTLFTHTRPLTAARFLALAQEHASPFYDGSVIAPNSAGIAILSPSHAAQAFAVEAAPPLLFDRPGLLAMAVSQGQAQPSRLLITDHGNTEVDGHAVVFGQCDNASVKLVAALRHTLQSTDNHPATPVAVQHIAIVPAGKRLPAVTAEAVPPGQPATPSSTPPASSPAPRSGPEPTGPTAILETTAGDLACRLFASESPIATGVFLGLVDGSKDWTDPTTHLLQHNHRFYDNMPIDRVLPDYYIQFGDITGDISGNTDIGFRFKNETTPGLTFDRPGRLAFGNGGPDTNNSELFFALNPIHALDGGYTILGQCDEASVAILDQIAQQPRDNSNRPLTPILIRRITIQP